jgi:hypothetical protein
MINRSTSVNWVGLLVASWAVVFCLAGPGAIRSSTSGKTGGLAAGLGSSTEIPVGKGGQGNMTWTRSQPAERRTAKGCMDKNYSGYAWDESSPADSVCFRLEKKLVDAALKCDIGKMRKALDDGANVNGSYFESYTPLVTAIESRRKNAVDAVIFLINHGADVDRSANLLGNQPLAVAAHEGNADIVRVLLERGANVCIQMEGATPEQLARERGHGKVAEMIRAATSTNCKSDK